MVSAYPATGTDWTPICRSLGLAVLVLLAAITPRSANSQGLLPSQGPGPKTFSGRPPAADLSQLQTYDPAAAAFNAQLSYGAMSQLAPIIFGDFLSPTALKLAPSFVGPMGNTAAFDPAVSSTLNQTFQMALLSAGGPAETEEFDVGQSDTSLPSSAVDPGGNISSGQVVGYSATAGDYPTLSLDETSGKASSGCPDSETARTLQSSSGFWGPKTQSALPSDFPKAVFSGRSLSNPLGDLGPRGDRFNLPPVGPAGSWCRPGPIPFDLTSPLENRLVLIFFGLLAAGVLAFYLTRGIRLPAI